jgi:hypothetical protein
MDSFNRVLGTSLSNKFWMSEVSATQNMIHDTEKNSDFA